MELFILKQFRSVYWAEWVADPFALKLDPLIQNNISIISVMAEFRYVSTLLDMEMTVQCSDRTIEVLL